MTAGTTVTVTALWQYLDSRDNRDMDSTREAGTTGRVTALWQYLDSRDYSDIDSTMAVFRLQDTPATDS